ncbi:MAG TPA: TetR/AcrR family transcriptional regulator [Kofleriaceae bacterium]|nr:TetR/AcrR family transcriptional regulator [Kofleriaceae bacterium]
MRTPRPSSPAPPLVLSPTNRRRQGARTGDAPVAPGAPGDGAGPAGDRPAHRPGRRELQRQDTERLILTTALSLFAAHGFEATTTKQIADAAGVAHGTVFLVATTKEALLVKVLEQQLREVVASRTRSLPRRGILAQLVYVFDGLFDFYAAQPGLSRVFLKGIMFFAEPIARAMYDEHVARFASYLAAMFEAARQRGEIAARTRCDAAAANVLAIYVHAVVGFLNADRPDRAALGAQFRAGLDQMFRGLAPARRGKPPRARSAPRPGSARPRRAR